MSNFKTDQTDVLPEYDFVESCGDEPVAGKIEIGRDVGVFINPV